MYKKHREFVDSLNVMLLGFIQKYYRFCFRFSKPTHLFHDKRSLPNQLKQKGLRAKKSLSHIKFLRK